MRSHSFPIGDGWEVYTPIGDGPGKAEIVGRRHPVLCVHIIVTTLHIDNGDVRNGIMPSEISIGNEDKCGIFSKLEVCNVFSILRISFSTCKVESCENG